MRKLIVKFFYLIQAIKRMNRFHLMNTVVYENENYILTQGVNNPYWNLSGKARLLNIHQDTFKLKHPIKGRIDRIKFYYKFKMGYWFLIDTWNIPLFSPISKI